MKAVITVVGRDTVGILAQVCTVCAAHNVNVEEVTQRILRGTFAMIMLVDLSGCTCDFAAFAQDMEAKGRDLGVDVRCISPVDPTRAPAALAGRSAVLIQGCGALVAALNAEEGEAVLALLKKECLAEINARLYGGAAPLPLLDRIYMRNVYLNRYSKLK